jgi:hypothetical protein
VPGNIIHANVLLTPFCILWSTFEMYVLSFKQKFMLLQLMKRCSIITHSTKWL